MLIILISFPAYSGLCSKVVALNPDNVKREGRLWILISYRLQFLTVDVVDALEDVTEKKAESRKSTEAEVRIGGFFDGVGSTKCDQYRRQAGDSNHGEPAGGAEFGRFLM